MKSNQKLTLLFWHRKSKANARGFAPVYCRISIDGNEEELSIGKKVHLHDWDVDQKKVKGAGEAKKTNLKMSQVTVDLERQFILLQSQFGNITPLMLKNVYQGLPAIHKKGRQRPEIHEPAPTLLQVADKHIVDFTKMVKKGLRSPDTLRQWRATRNKIVEFLKFQF